MGIPVAFPESSEPLPVLFSPSSLQMLVINPPPLKDSIGSFNLLPSPLQLLLLLVLLDFSLYGKVRDSVLLDDPMVAS